MATLKFVPHSESMRFPAPPSPCISRPPSVSTLSSIFLLIFSEFMAQFRSQTLIREFASFFPRNPPPFAHSFRLVNYRNRSNRSEKAQLVEIDLEVDADVEVFGLRRLEDAINAVFARRLAPDWLPFIPGSSYWVPPRRLPLGESGWRLKDSLTEEESLSFTAVQGWPSSSYFLEGGSPRHAIKVKSGKSITTMTESEDEEG